MLKRFPANTRGRDFVVGDIHGHYDALMQGLDDQCFNRHSDRLFMLGDLIDRGPDSRKCLELVYEPWAFSVLGNHELMMWDAINNGESSREASHWFSQGGSWFYFEDNRAEAGRLALDALDRMSYAIELEVNGKRLGLVHGEPPAQGWHVLEDALQQEGDPDGIKQRLAWSRRKIKESDCSVIDGIDAVACGHTVVDEPTLYGNTVYLETGVSRAGGRLTIVEASALVGVVV